MHLAKVKIENFRSLKNVTVDLQPGLNVVLGRNNCGKTNLLCAIRHAIGPAGTRGEAAWISEDDFFRASVNAKRAQTISVTLTFEGLSESQRAHFYEIVDFNLVDLPKSKAVLRFEASWPEGKRHPTLDRWGGGPSADRAQIPAGILESLPVTFLPALRDAEAALAPGMRSRLALLLKDLVKGEGDAAKARIEGIFKKANDDLEVDDLIKPVTSSLKGRTQSIAGSDYAPSVIRAAPAELDRILRTLCVQMENMPVEDLSANGLGYNNLLYIAVILEHLRSPVGDECPLLLVEEPEAHLHPQLATLLADYLAREVPGEKTPQTIVTSHSPTLAAHVPPSRVHVLFTDSAIKEQRCNSIAKAGMDEKEETALQRMMDVTKASLYFAKGIILVEGISEALLLPVLAKRIGHDFSKLHISVIPICGVAFKTFLKLFQPDALGIPVAIVTDADPPVIRGENWESDCPEASGAAFRLSDRTAELEQLFNGHVTTIVKHSQVTLEYDLAEAGGSNAETMVEVWKECFTGNPGTFNTERLKAVGNDRKAKALCAWRGICQASTLGSKAEFAQRLSLRLKKFGKNGTPTEHFDVPPYIKIAIEFVAKKVIAAIPQPAAPEDEHPRS
jgi:putative ATP-dependent endonuclease of OLD family